MSSMGVYGELLESEGQVLSGLEACPAQVPSYVKQGQRREELVAMKIDRSQRVRKRKETWTQWYCTCCKVNDV